MSSHQIAPSPAPDGSSLAHSGTLRLQRLAAPAGSPLPLPCALAVFAHPDDEVLALGARLERFRSSRFLTLTDGAPADGADARHHGFASLAEYRAARQAELLAAFAHAGLGPAHLLTTEVRTPGTTPLLPVPDQTAALHLVALTRAVAATVAALAPEIVLTHPYEGGHPDHDACALAVHTAVRLLAATGHPTPTLAEAPSYHAAINQPDSDVLQTGTFLLSDPPVPTLVHDLTPAEQAAKRARLACFTSQAETLAQFGTTRERFRLAPAYDFTRAPHPGRLLYERFPWGMDGARFNTLAAEALATLLPTPAPAPPAPAPVAVAQ